ncbi:MAG: hypothetical protein ACK55X_00510, partial [Synechococcaceae cyanobacterium]
MPWFIKHETFRQPYAAMRPHLEAHRQWVAQQRRQGVRISSGYLVDGQEQPGGGGQLLQDAPDPPSPEAQVRQAPNQPSRPVDRSQHRRIPVQ